MKVIPKEDLIRILTASDFENIDLNYCIALMEAYGDDYHIDPETKALTLHTENERRAKLMKTMVH